MRVAVSCEGGRYATLLTGRGGSNFCHMLGMGEQQLASPPDSGGRRKNKRECVCRVYGMEMGIQLVYLPRYSFQSAEVLTSSEPLWRCAASREPRCRGAAFLCRNLSRSASVLWPGRAASARISSSGASHWLSCADHHRTRFCGRETWARRGQRVPDVSPADPPAVPPRCRPGTRSSGLPYYPCWLGNLCFIQWPTKNNNEVLLQKKLQYC